MCPSTHRSLLGAISLLGLGMAVIGCRGAEPFRVVTDGGSPIKAGGSGGIIAVGGSGGSDFDAGEGTGGSGGGSPDGSGGSGGGTGGMSGAGGSGGAAGSGGAVDARPDLGSGGAGGTGGTGGVVDAPVERVDAGGGAGGADVPPINGCLNTSWNIAANTLCTTQMYCPEMAAELKEPRFAIDGDMATRYTSGYRQGVMEPDETVTLSFARTVTISGLRLRTTNGDGIAAYRLEYSTNGTTFMVFTPSITGTGSDDLTIAFPATAMRAIRIIQTSSKPMGWWSIHELTVLGCVNS